MAVQLSTAVEGRQGSDGNISTRETAAATQTFIKRLAGLYIFCLNLHLMANCDAAPTKDGGRQSYSAGPHSHSKKGREECRLLNWVLAGEKLETGLFIFRFLAHRHRRRRHRHRP